MDGKFLIIFLGCLCVAYAARSASRPVDKQTEKIGQDAMMTPQKNSPAPAAKCGMSFQKVIFKTYQTEETRIFTGLYTTYYFNVDLQFRGDNAGAGRPMFARNKALVVSVPKGRGLVTTVDVNPCA
ncbi:uncharacterized protein LOC129589775 [Paramacrobiotus metropolitanus]|uniref:uncharacterized protein LOC129589775 n=1 Tax=Paramacrobiotus metropolitanus TaxID=2943436 RepID=UPI0024463658|nr:uncharacterized protein LOC129589775 [Paramacrobiotus metropolitanus]